MRKPSQRDCPHNVHLLRMLWSHTSDRNHSILRPWQRCRDWMRKPSQRDCPPTVHLLRMLWSHPSDWPHSILRPWLHCKGWILSPVWCDCPPDGHLRCMLWDCPPGWPHGILRPWGHYGGRMHNLCSMIVHILGICCACCGVTCRAEITEVLTLLEATS